MKARVGAKITLFVAEKKEEISQTIHIPLPSWTSRSNFAMEKQARSASSLQTEMK